MAGELVVGYDGGEGAKAALGQAIRLAQSEGRRLAIVFGYEPTQRAAEAADLRRAIEGLGRRHLDEAIATIAGRVDAEVFLVPQRAAEALLSVATDKEASMIVVGATERGPLAGAVLGSVPHRLVHTSHVPVLIVPSE